MSEMILITSGKGGTGKTTATAQIGMNLAKMNKKVILIEAGTGLRNLDVLFRIEDLVFNTLSDVASGKCDIDDALMKDKDLSNLYLIAASQTKLPGDISKEQMSKLTELLKEKADYVLIDSPAGIDYGFQLSMQMSDKAILVVTPDILAVRDADRVAGLLRNQGIRDIRLIINRSRADLIQAGNMMSSEDIQELLPYELLGIIPEDDKILISVSKMENPSIPESPACREFADASRRLTGEEVPFNNITSTSSEGLWKRFRRFLGVS